ncbi:uncharacterized protein LOC141852064 [Brevipalpus obovatus]|uniref:uncharacterized protein LOC141852064 n=1 Tax=Brevipalpus obovatus TaxID=246614 RepID=UPI003D9EA795
MDYCCGCNRKWANIKKSDKDKYHYKIVSDEMAEFFEEKSGFGVMQGWKVCRKCRDKWNSKLTSDRKRENPPGFAQVSDPYLNPVAGPSSAMDEPMQGSSAMIEPMHESRERGYESCPTLPSIFSPTSFTPSPRRRDVFVFPPQGNDLDGSSDDSDGSGDSGGPPDNVDQDPDEETPEEEEPYVPSYRVSISSRQSCIHGCQTDDFARVPASTRAEILLSYQIYVPEGARVCRQHAQSVIEPRTVNSEWTVEQSVEALKLLATRVEKRGMVTIPPSNSAQASKIKDLTGLAPGAFDDLLTHLSRFKNPRQSWGALLHHYKTGLAMKKVALLFGINDKTFSRQAKKNETATLRQLRSAQSWFRTFGQP